MDQTEPVMLRINKNDVIVALSRAWDDFALQNGAAELVAPKVIGSNFYQHIADEPTRMHIKVLVDYARTLNKEVCRHYRCDSEGVKRFMQMRIRSAEDGDIVFEHRLLRAEPLSRPAQFSHTYLASDVLRCSVCGQLQAGTDVWRDTDDPDLSQEVCSDTVNLVNYDICQACEDQISVMKGLL